MKRHCLTARITALLRSGEEVTFKRLRRERQIVRPKPQNGEYEEIVIPAEEVKSIGL